LAESVLFQKRAARHANADRADANRDILGWKP
jgi:hypothetical protein